MPEYRKLTVEVEGTSSDPDVFHSHVSIAELDGLEVTVRDGDEILIEKADHKGYTLQDHGVLYGKEQP